MDRSSSPDAVPDLDLTESEQAALHDLQLGIEHVYRAYGALLEYHHELGGAMDRVADAETALRDAGHEEWANALRDEHLPSGAIDDRWTYELVDAFAAGFLPAITDFEQAVRDDLAAGVPHVTEREQQRRWRERADGWPTGSPEDSTE